MTSQNRDMVKTHSLGYPRIGAKRELKVALESYWKGQSDQSELLQSGQVLRKGHWEDQSELDLTPVGDFSFYDQVLDMSFTLGNLPSRAQGFKGETLDNYFRIARGRSVALAADEPPCSCDIAAGEMTKWFDTNYHYIVPEFSKETSFKLDSSRLLEQVKEAQELGVKAKPVIIGPLTYLSLGKSKDQTEKLQLLSSLLPVYQQLLKTLAETGVEWVQIDEPILVTELAPEWKDAFYQVYHSLAKEEVKVLLATYFGTLADNLSLVAELPVAGIHLDAINARSEVEVLQKALPASRVLSLGIINGRNVWKTDLTSTLDWLEPVAQELGSRLWLSPSCSLLHVPVDLASEQKIDQEVRGWLSFAKQKLQELSVLSRALNHGRSAVEKELAENVIAMESRRNSSRVHQKEVQAALSGVSPEWGKRQGSYPERSLKQRASLQLPQYPTTTIGSFPQTKEIRKIRSQYKKGTVNQDAYLERMKEEISDCVEKQEALGLDVLVHGEPERNDMVEYFGEQLDGYAFTDFGWVQSYGSRCVKPPLLFGDISRPIPMTVDWTTYAQSLTEKPLKGMLTGPVTILNWSFVRDDQPRSVSCYQLALAIREEVLDLEKAGIQIIQIDEAALREGLPLRQAQWKEYLDWAVESFRIAANGVSDETQIHTHMCYSEFNDIIESIAEMDADVITIETSRSDMELLDVFDDFKYPNEIGPGVYDIHSPNLPTVDHMVQLLEKAALRIPADRLWVNPDCGLKTRQWDEVIPALERMVEVATTLRAKTHQLSCVS